MHHWPKKQQEEKVMVRTWLWISCFFLSSGALRFWFPNKAANNWGNESIYIFSQSSTSIRRWGNNLEWRVTVNGWLRKSAQNSTSPIPWIQRQSDICTTISWIPIVLGKWWEGYDQYHGVMEKLCDEAPLGAPSTPQSLTLWQKYFHWCRGEEGKGNAQLQPERSSFPQGKTRILILLCTMRYITRFLKKMYVC